MDPFYVSVIINILLPALIPRNAFLTRASDLSSRRSARRLHGLCLLQTNGGGSDRMFRAAKLILHEKYGFVLGKVPSEHTSMIRESQPTCALFLPSMQSQFIPVNGHY